MIKIEFNKGVGVVKVRGSKELLEIEMSIMVKTLVNESPELFRSALINNVELLEKIEKEVKS